MITAVIAQNNDEVLASHKMTSDLTDILLWGDLFKEKSLEDWKKMKGEEECKKMLDKGIDTSSIEFMETGNIKSLMNG